MELLESILLGHYEFAIFDGKHFKFPETQVRPKAGHPERIHFYGAIGSPGSAEIMADLGIPILQGTNFPDMYTAKFAESWRNKAQQNGMRTDDVELPVMALPTMVAETDKEAMKLANQYWPVFIQVQMEHYETLADHWKNISGYEQFSKMFAHLEKLKHPGPDLDKFLALQVVGSPDSIIKRIEVMHETFGANHINCVFGSYEVPYEVRRRSMKLFAENVIPHFRRKAAA